MDYLNSSRKTLLSDYENNPLLKLVFFCGAGYIMLHLAKIVIFMWQQVPSPESTAYFENKIYIHFAIQPFESMLKHPWTLLTFMFTGLGFFKLFTTLVWLFVFGSVIQQLVGKSEILPLFIVSNIIGGIAFIALQYYFPLPSPANMFSGADAAVLGFSLGALSVAPKYKIYFSSNFSVPLWLLIVIYLIINILVLFESKNYPYFGLLIAGGLAGVLYMQLANKGVKLGVACNKMLGWGAHKVAAKKKVGDKTFTEANAELDAILDKINEQGIQSLTREERELLKRYQ